MSELQPKQTQSDQSSAPQALAHPVGTLYEIRWSEICPWLILVKALRVTLLLRVLILAVIGVALTHWGWTAIDQLTSQVHPAVREVTDYPENLIHPSVPLESPLLRGQFWLSESFFKLIDREISLQESLALILYGLWAIAVWGLFGGAIARIAAMYLARGETLGPLIAVREATIMWPSTVGAPLIVLLAAVAMAVPLVLIGLLIQIHFMAILIGLLWVFVLAFGFMLAVVLLGLAIGWPLMWACLGVERSDAFDGVSRCYAYVYQRPLQLAFYALVAALLALLGETVVHVFATATTTMTEWALSWGSGNERANYLLGTNWQETSSALRAISGWKKGLDSLVAAYPLACLWPLSVGIYLLLRRHVDATEMDEITLPDGTTQPAQEMTKDPITKDEGMT